MTDGFLLDSNICIYMLKGESSWLRQRVVAQPEGSLFISSVSLAELSVGYGGRILEAPGIVAMLEAITVLPFDTHAAAVYGALPFKRARFDRLIAAHALALGLTLVTNNGADFADIPGLRVENWTLPL
ncbi:type II toxin-antitoxin system VapC family toxin [Sphingosinicella microcystinivorans]|uniref:type II toxin-antitoxin system VapC family toxin n=1 Tax=Sphingosinicella microcystinivorans TaxID=335406 RepID=UPI0022F3E00B|nr:type II toxin-antitoxin system VapC family toxin [Sphingosinicella microcystinivorans]WBX85045.1 type II toxin-antitoxin system VapC family toxin [Sphingosinicella microcystinivorans]